MIIAYIHFYVLRTTFFVFPRGPRGAHFDHLQTRTQVVQDQPSYGTQDCGSNAAAVSRALRRLSREASVASAALKVPHESGD